jgi:hypothetical protein
MATYRVRHLYCIPSDTDVRVRNLLYGDTEVLGTCPHCNGELVSLGKLDLTPPVGTVVLVGEGGPELWWRPPVTLTAEKSFKAKLRNRLFPPENPYVRDPVGWVHDTFGEVFYSAQAGMVESVLHNKQTVVKAAHSVGKTRGLSRLALWWIDVHPIGEALVVITSDNDDQIKGGVWREVIAGHAKAGLPGKVTLDSKWHAGSNNQTLVAFGRKPSDKNPTGLQGFHAKYMLVIIDECAGVPAELWDARESLASNRGGVILAAGNRSGVALRRGVQAGIGLGSEADQCLRHARVYGRGRARGRA